MAASKESVSSLSRRSFVKGAGVASAAALLTALGISSSDARFAGAAEGGTTFTYAIAGDPGSNVNPVTTAAKFGLMELKLVFSPLYAVRDEGTVWYLAESYDESDDHLSYTFHLRDGVTWSDGEPLTADDVVFSYQTIESIETADAYSSLNYGDAGKVEVEAIDDLTVKFTFPFQDGAALEALQGPDGVYIFPRHVYEGVDDYDNSEVNDNPVGSGPYTLVDYQPGSYVQFAANPSYFEGAPNIDTVIFQIITNENTGLQAIQAGQVDAWLATPSEAEQIQTAGGDLTITAFNELQIANFFINTKRVSDENVRKALFYALDREAIGNAAMLSSDYYYETYTILPPYDPFYDDSLTEKYDRDVDKAKQLLADSGNPNPTFVLGYPGSFTQLENAALIIKENAEEAGFSIDLRSVDMQALSKARRDPDSEYDGSLSFYSMGVDPDLYRQLFQSGAPANYAHYDNPVLDDLFDQGRAETDPDKRHAIYAQLQAEIQDHATFYPLYAGRSLLVTGSRVSGLDDAKLAPIVTFDHIDKLQVSD